MIGILDLSIWTQIENCHSEGCKCADCTIEWLLVIAEEVTISREHSDALQQTTKQRNHSRNFCLPISITLMLISYGKSNITTCLMQIMRIGCSIILVAMTMRCIMNNDNDSVHADLCLPLPGNIAHQWWVMSSEEDTLRPMLMVARNITHNTLFYDRLRRCRTLWGPQRNIEPFVLRFFQHNAPFSTQRKSC